MTTKLRSSNSIRDLQVALAEQLIRMEAGQRLPSIKKLASSAGMSVGSVSLALNTLEDMGAVHIQKRGHLGSMVESISVGKLWNLVEQGPFVIALSLPMHSHFEGLATALKMAVEKTGIETYMIFIRGSHTRLKAVTDNRCHVAVMSGLAADELCDRRHEILFRLPPGTWISGYSTFYRSPAPNPGQVLRVAVDPDSYDHERLTRMEFEEQEVEYKRASFVQLPRLLKKGEVDAILWTKDQEESFASPDIYCEPISERVMKLIGERSISATIVARAGRPTVRAVLGSAIKAEEIIEIQNRVVSGQLIPEY